MAPLSIVLFVLFWVVLRRRHRRLAAQLGAPSVAILVPNGSEAWAVPVSTAPSRGRAELPLAKEAVHTSGGCGRGKSDVVVGVLVTEDQDSAVGQGIVAGIPVD